MPSVAVSLTPVDRARRRIELPVITADDTPTRNPCKVKGTPGGRSFRNEPYGFKAIEKGQPQQQQQQQPGPPAPMGPAKVRVSMPALSDETNNSVHNGGGGVLHPQPPQTQLLAPVVHVGARPKPKVSMALGLEAPEAPQRGPVVAGGGAVPPAPISDHSGDITPGGPSTISGTTESSPNVLLSRELTNESTTSTAPTPPKGLGIESPQRGGQTPHTPSGQAQVNLSQLSPPKGGVNQDPSPSEAFASGGRESKFKSTKPAIPMTEKKYTDTAGLAVVVKFKHQDGVFIIPENSEEPYREGDYVVVEGDRGEHVGRIDQMHIHHRHSTGNVGTIQRKAYAPEIDLVHRLRMQEPQITRQVQTLADQMDVAMEVIDTELQTDRNKVTVYYRSKVDGPVDFRQLQRRLFREFRCRIWFIDWETM